MKILKNFTDDILPNMVGCVFILLLVWACTEIVVAIIETMMGVNLGACG